MKLLIASRRSVVRLTALVLLGLALGLVTASGSLAAPPKKTESGPSVSIAPKAYVYDAGLTVETQLTFTCSGGSGTADVSITQTPAQSGNGIGASGSSPSIVEATNCDGSPHKLDVTVFADSGILDIGKATAIATLTNPSGTATDTRTISLVSV